MFQLWIVGIIFTSLLCELSQTAPSAAESQVQKREEGLNGTEPVGPSRPPPPPDGRTRGPPCAPGGPSAPAYPPWYRSPPSPFSASDEFPFPFHEPPLPFYCRDVITADGACVIDDMIIHEELCVAMYGAKFYDDQVQKQARYERMRVSAAS